VTQRDAPREVVRWRGGSRLHGIRCRGLHHRSSVALSRSPLRHRRRPPPNELLPTSDVFNAADHGGITLAGLTTDRRSSPASSPASASPTASSTMRRSVPLGSLSVYARPHFGTLQVYNQNLLLRLVEIHIRVKQANFLDGSVEFCVRELDWYLDSGQTI
jgi:hypothetical protein